MNKKRFIIILLVLAIFTLNFSMAQDVDSANGVVLSNLGNSADSNSTDLIKTDINVVSYTNFNAVGGNFKIKLVDENKTGLASQNVTFDINGVTYDRITDDEGIASLKLRLDDGLYNITTEFFGNSVYGASSKTTLININNTRIVDAGMPNSQIQEIIDNAKVNNVILFNGGSYDDINLIINKSLTLISNSNTVLKSGSSAPVITIQGKNASLTKIKGFVIKGEGDGILVNGSDYVILSNNEVTSNGNGITAKDTSYLNIGWNDHVIDDLRESTFQGKDPKYSGKTSSFTYVQNHLGYRYVVDGVKLTKETTNYENFAAEVSIKNVGFANIVKDMKTTVIIEGEGGKYEYPVSKLSKDKKESAENADPRNWLAGKTSVLKVNLDLPEKMKEGSYKVYLRVAYDENKKGIEGYPVKFANDDSSIWNETLGANYLGKFKVVSESTIEKEGAKVENKTSSKSPSYKIDKSSSFYTFSDKKDGCHISYTKSKTENWKNIAINFSDVDTSKYKKVVIKVVPSRKGMNLGITNQDENKPVFYKDHWDKNNQFTSTKEQTITINLDSKNKNGIYIYCDATKNDTPSGKQTFVIKSITFKK